MLRSLTIAFILLGVGLLSGCATANFTPQLSPEGAKVQVQKSDPPSGCQDLGIVTQRNLDRDPKVGQVWLTPEGIRNGLKNKSAEKGANYVRLERAIVGQGGTLVEEAGTAYKCP